MLYDDFKPIVDLVLNNWTALQLAVENGMGAPGGEKVSISYANGFTFCMICIYTHLYFKINFIMLFDDFLV